MAMSMSVAPCSTLVSQTRAAKDDFCPRILSLKHHHLIVSSSFSCLYSSQPNLCALSYPFNTSPNINDHTRKLCRGYVVVACLSSSMAHSAPPTSTKLYISGLSFRTTEESLRNAFEKFGELVEVNLVMDRIAKRPKGFAFISYATGDESQKAIEGMHGKFLDGRVIFVEVAKPRSQLCKNKHNF